MALPFEEATAELRREVRERHHRIIASLPRQAPTQVFLADVAGQSLDLSIKLEDVIMSLSTITIDPPAADRNAHQRKLDTALGLLRTAQPVAAAVFGRTTAACKYDCSSVAESLSFDDDLPGLSHSQVKAIKSSYAHSQQLEARARLPSPQYGYSRRLHSQLAAATATLQSQPVSVSAASALPATPAPVPARRPDAAATTNGRAIYPCRSCNVLGHWRDDGVCKPEDVKANIMRLTALLNPGQLALPAPGQGTSGMNLVLLVCIFTFTCFDLYFELFWLSLFLV